MCLLCVSGLSLCHASLGCVSVTCLWVVCLSCVSGLCLSRVSELCLCHVSQGCVSDGVLRPSCSQCWVLSAQLRVSLQLRVFSLQLRLVSLQLWVVSLHNAAQRRVVSALLGVSLQLWVVSLLSPRTQCAPHQRRSVYRLVQGATRAGRGVRQAEVIERFRCTTSHHWPRGKLTSGPISRAKKRPKKTWGCTF